MERLPRALQSIAAGLPAVPRPGGCQSPAPAPRAGCQHPHPRHSWEQTGSRGWKTCSVPWRESAPRPWGHLCQETSSTADQGTEVVDGFCSGLSLGVCCVIFCCQRKAELPQLTALGVVLGESIFCLTVSLTICKNVMVSRSLSLFQIRLHLSMSLKDTHRCTWTTQSYLYHSFKEPG